MLAPPLHACKIEREIKRELEQLVDPEQFFWMRKSRTNWILHGVRNTKFYYTITVRKRIRGRINEIFNSQGKWIDQHEKISSTFCNHFKKLFANLRTIFEEMMRSKIQSLNIPCLSNKHKEILNLPFSSEEVRIDAFQIRPLKALRIDGKPRLFYQRF